MPAEPFELCRANFAEIKQTLRQIDLAIRGNGRPGLRRDVESLSDRVARLESVAAEQLTQRRRVRFELWKVLVGMVSGVALIWLGRLL